MITEDDNQDFLSVRSDCTTGHFLGSTGLLLRFDMLMLSIQLLKILRRGKLKYAVVFDEDVAMYCCIIMLSNCVHVCTEDNLWTVVTNNLPPKTTVTGSSRERRTILQVNYSASMDQVRQTHMPPKYFLFICFLPGCRKQRPDSRPTPLHTP